MSDNTKLLSEILTELRHLRTQFQAVARALKSDAPNYQRPLAAFGRFDWSSIGAIVLESDQDGVSKAEYNGHQFTRRSKTGKFGDGIWFSRPTGKSEDGSNLYARLITFKDHSQAEAMPGKLATAVQPSQPVRPAQPARANGATRPAQPAPAGDMFVYEYGDKRVVPQPARAHFDAYRRAHGEAVPADGDSLKAWCVAQGRIPANNGESAPKDGAPKEQETA